MKLNSTHTLYKHLDATSCSRPQLVLLLLDGAIRYTREAADHLVAQRWPEKGTAIEAAYECLAELRRGLDLTNGGEVAAQLDQMYDLLCTKLTLGNMRKDTVEFQQVVRSLEDLRQAWAELFDRLRREGKLKEVPTDA